MAQYQQPLQPQYYPPQSATMPAAPREKKRNVALILIGLVFLLLSLAVGALFAYNLWQYLTVEDRWANSPMLPEARRFGVAIVQRAAEKRMMLFGPVSGFLGFVGLVLAGLGLRKR